MIVDKVIEYKQSQIRQYPVNSNRASQLGHPCTRFLVFERTRWQEKILIDARLQMVFDIGNDIESRVMRDLVDAGFQVIEQQRSYSWPEYQITAHLDAKVIIDGKVYPIEVKSMSPYVFQKVNTVDDMKQSKYHYMRGYPAQITLYLLLDNKEQGYFILKNKSTGEMKEILVTLDYELGENLLMKADIVNMHVRRGTIPNPIEWDDYTCAECGYLHICMPDRIGQEVQVIDDAELLELLNKRAELAPIAKEFAEVDSQVKDAVRNRDKLMIGDWFITGKTVKKKDTEYWLPKIVKVA
jgi:CRISPR/Cas system-associated exonuclease Cas4 (RecB family)